MFWVIFIFLWNRFSGSKFRAFPRYTQPDSDLSTRVNRRRVGGGLLRIFEARFAVSSVMVEVKQEMKVVALSGTPGMESGRLYVEMRIPKVDDEGDPEGGGGDAETVTVEDRMVACGICGKSFRSKKALSGHMRVHVQNRRESMKKCWKLAAGVDLVSAEGKPPMCAVCGSMFRSMNALYGHMRLHPDRGWRGVQPPVTVVNPEPVIDFDVLTAVIVGWSVTGKRGRRSIAPVHSGSFPSSEVEDLCTPRNGLEEKDDIHSFEGEDGETAKSARVAVESYLIPEQHTVPDNQRMKNRTIKRKVRELNEINRDHSSKGATTDVVGRVSADKYTCKRCNKSFTTHQVLGGHMSSCNKSNQSAGRSVPSTRPRTEYSEGAAVGLVAATYHFHELFSRLGSGTAECAHSLTDFDLNKLPTMEESEDNEGETNAEVGCGSI